MSFFGRLFGTDTALKSTIDAVSNGLDSLVYTDQERSDDAAKDRSEARRMIVGWMQATQGQNLARRLIALKVTVVWVSLYITSVICAMLSVGSDNRKDLLEISNIALDAAFEIQPAAMLILLFYFAAPHMGEFANSFFKHKKRS